MAVGISASRDTPVADVPLVQARSQQRRTNPRHHEAQLGILLSNCGCSDARNWPIFNSKPILLSVKCGNDVGKRIASMKLGEFSKAVRIVCRSRVPDLEVRRLV